MNTPEFLMWAVEWKCGVRGFQDGSDPEKTERQLRGARAVSDAVREERVYEGVAVLGEEGFQIEGVMGVYGGRGAAEDACAGCVANVLAVQEQKTLAGCFGMMVCPWRSEGFHAAVDGAMEKACGAGELISRTRPAWYGLWMGSPLVGEKALFVAGVLEGIEKSEREGAKGLDELAFALRAAVEREFLVHVAAYAEGLVDGRWFALAPHCPKCKMTWPAQEKRVCPACGYEGPAPSLRKRRARGKRPYFPLARVLGEEGAREFLSRYAVYRAR